ncbi:hypothetical protein HD596_010333 [Nonomuraea jabiensis]|uniref:Uncharacterized protein n=1 Tax=Nonomuraea jabiensis TaxID=882448 RepID=A0A7W9GGY5_9ACTN|nr:hypothetical protein [Nonomuraea jabiensis]
MTSAREHMTELVEVIDKHSSLVMRPTKEGS